MKAKEYFEKYGESVWVDAHTSDTSIDCPTNRLFMDFVTETQEIIDKRKVRFDRGTMSVIEEQNTKWNALVNLFIKKYGATPIARDGFKTVIMKEIAGK